MFEHRNISKWCAEESATPRRRSLRKSLRESFRHLRKRRIPISSLLHRRGRTDAKATTTAADADAPGKSAVDEGRMEQPAAEAETAAAETAPTAAWVLEHYDFINLLLKLYTQYTYV